MSQRRIVDGPQLDGSPSWESTLTLFIASHGTRARSSARRPRSRSRTSGHFRVRLQMESRVRELALFNLGIDSKLRGCDLVSLKVRDICHSDQVATRAVVM